MKDKPVILVVDDQAQNIELVEAHLVPQGYEVVKAASGEEAIEKLSGNQIDLVLLDIMMPGMDGYDVCKKVKSDSENTFLPIIMLTVLDNMEAKIEGLEAGADDFLNIPFQKIELIARIKNLLKMKFLHEKVEQLAIMDGLTNIYNHRYFQETLKIELDRLKRYPQIPAEKLSIIMIDVDSFKHYNDTNGHTAGDAVLVEIGQILKEMTRKVDIVARYGGEEFILLVSSTSKAGAIVLAERIRKRVEEHPFEFGMNQSDGKLTISVGISTYDEDGRSPKNLIEMADKALYQAKTTGRNKVCYINPPNVKDSQFIK